MAEQRGKQKLVEFRSFFLLSIIFGVARSEVRTHAEERAISSTFSRSMFYLSVSCDENYRTVTGMYPNMFSRETNILIGPDMKLESRSMREDNHCGKEGNERMVR